MPLRWDMDILQEAGSSRPSHPKPVTLEGETTLQVDTY